jgi:hypothetical protein
MRQPPRPSPAPLIAPVDPCPHRTARGWRSSAIRRSAHARWRAACRTSPAPGPIGKTDAPSGCRSAPSSTRTRERPVRDGHPARDRRYTHRELHQISNQWANSAGGRAASPRDVTGRVRRQPPRDPVRDRRHREASARSRRWSTPSSAATCSSTATVARATRFVIGESCGISPPRSAPRSARPGADRVLWLREQASAACRRHHRRRARGGPSPATWPRSARSSWVTLLLHLHPAPPVARGVGDEPQPWPGGGRAFGMAAMRACRRDDGWYPPPLITTTLTVAWSSAKCAKRRWPPPQVLGHSSDDCAGPRHRVRLHRRVAPHRSTSREPARPRPHHPLHRGQRPAPWTSGSSLAIGLASPGSRVLRRRKATSRRQPAQPWTARSAWPGALRADRG